VGEQVERPQARLEQPRRALDVLEHRISQLRASQSVLDVTHARGQRHPAQSAQRPRRDHWLGVAWVHLGARRERLGGHGDDPVVHLEPRRTQRRRRVDQLHEPRQEYDELVGNLVEAIHVISHRPHHRGGQRLAWRALTNHTGEALDRLVGPVEDHRLLGRKVVVDGLLRDAHDVGDLRDLDVVEAAGAEQNRGHVRYPLAGEPALALAQPLVGMAPRLRRLLEPPHPAQRAGQLLAELADEHPVNPVVGKRIVKQLLVVVHL